MGPKEIKDIRIKLGLSQEAFARLLGMSYPSVNRWEQGKAKPSPLAIHAIKRCMPQEKDEECDIRKR